jgi:hypothetical protein
MQWISWVAKALTAAGTAFLGALIHYQVDASPWIMVVVVTLIAGIAVFLVPNGDKPTT